VWQRFERPCFDAEGRNSTPSLRDRAIARGAESSGSSPWQQRPWHDDRGDTDHTLGRSWPPPSPNSRRASAPSLLGHL
jgi:hypothetical protein